MFFKQRFVLFELLGIKVQIDPSWVVIAILITWSLATGLFPDYYAGFAPVALWTMAAVAMVGFFASLIVHEYAHALVARRDGTAIRGITLFVFGGVAELEDEPASAGGELRMAIAGPIASVVLSAMFYLAGSAGERIGWPEPALGVLYYLAAINFVLAAFNLLPAFPLDGGRVLRALLWQWRGDLRWATRIAANLGNGFGLALILLGLLAVIFENALAGIWWVLIGFFVRKAATASYMQVLATRAFQGMPIARFMSRSPVTVAPGISISELVERYIYGQRHDFFPVLAGDRLLGLVGIADVKHVPRAAWPTTLVHEIMAPATAENSVAPDTDAIRVLALMRRTGNSRLLVIEDGRLLGVVTLKDLLEFFGLKLDLDDAG